MPTPNATRPFKFAVAMLVAVSLAPILGWFWLMTTICSNPRQAVQATQHVIPYNCHGMRVYISPLQNAMRTWVLPVEVLVVLLCLCAALVLFLSTARAGLTVETRLRS